MLWVRVRVSLGSLFVHIRRVFVHIRRLFVHILGIGQGLERGLGLKLGFGKGSG